MNIFYKLTNPSLQIRFLIIIIVFCVPWGELTTLIKPLNISKLAMFVILVFALGRSAVKGRGFQKTPIDIPMLFFIIAIFPSFFYSKDFTIVTSFLISMVGYFILNILIFEYVNDLTFIHKIFIIWVLSLIIVSVLAIFPLITDVTILPSIPDTDRLFGLTGTESNPNAFGNHFVSVIPICFGLLLMTQRCIFKLFFGVTLMLFIITTLMTFSRAAMISAFSGMLSIVILNIWRGYLRIRHVIYFSAFLGVIIIMIFSHLPIEDTISQLTGGLEISKVNELKSEALHGRETLYPAQIKIFLDHPLLGVGYYESIDYVERYGSQSQNVQHNILIGIASEMGLIGLIPFIIILIITLLYSFYSLKECKDEFSFKLLSTILSALVANFLFGMTHFNLVSVGVWLLVAFSLVTSRSIKYTSKIKQLERVNI